MFFFFFFCSARVWFEARGAHSLYTSLPLLISTIDMFHMIVTRGASHSGPFRSVFCLGVSTWWDLTFGGRILTLQMCFFLCAPNSVTQAAMYETSYAHREPITQIVVTRFVVRTSIASSS